MRPAIFETERLIGLRWIGDEVEGLLAVYGDADAMRWVGDGLPLTRTQCEAWLDVTTSNYARRGYGMFALQEKASGKVIGFCGIVHPGNQVEAEVKYALLRPQWGKGLATEAVRSLIHYAYNQHGLHYIIATAAPENVASHRVLLNSGFTLSHLRSNDDGSKTNVFAWHAAHDVA